MARAAFSLAAVVVLAACLGTDLANSIEGDWLLQSGSWDGEPIPMVDTHPIEISFDGEEVRGTAACNGFGGSWQVRGGTFQITSLAVTEIACMPATVMESEQRFLDALLNVEAVEAADGRLHMTGSRTELTFLRLEPASELGVPRPGLAVGRQPVTTLDHSPDRQP